MARPTGTHSFHDEIPLRMAADRDFAGAVLWLDRALAEAATLEAKRHFAATLSEVARLAEEAGDLESAQRALASATSAADWADLHCQFGRLLVHRGRRTDARRELDRALAINPRYRAAAVERALLDAAEGRIAEALETLRVLASESAPAEPTAWRQGIARLGEADFDEAGSLLRRALAAGDEWLDEQLRAYQEAVFQGEPARALALLRAALEERPLYADLYVLLGTHELQSGAVDDAVESLTSALEINPDYHAARVTLARALETLGESPQALEQLELVLGRDSGHSEARQLREKLLARRPGPRGGAPAAAGPGAARASDRP